MCFHRQTLKRIGPDQPDPSERWRLKRSRILKGKQWGLIVLMGLLLSQCKGPVPQDLPFETITQGDGFYTGQGYGGLEPNILVIAGPDDIDKPGLDVQFPSEVAGQLRQLDYNRYFAILVLQGRKPSSGYQVTVRQIARRGDRVTIQAEFTEPQPETFIHPAFTSPFHLISVSKQGIWGQQVHLVLLIDDEEVAETFHLIP
jgi:hypothetical protein